jgi:hypothetical protein
MNRLRLPIVAATLVGASVLAACGGSATPKPTTPAVPSATAPSAAGTSTVAPSAAGPSASTSGAGSSVAPTEAAASAVAGSTEGAPSFAIPSFAVPSFAPDNDLAAKFPKTIDGQPVTNVQTYLFVDLLGFGGRNEAQIQQLSQSLAGFGIDLNKLSGGSADATVGGEDVQLQALRAPGGDASQIVTHYNEIAAVFGQVFGNAEQTSAPTMSQANVGGKNVTVATDADGNKTFLYANGDTLWIVDNTTDDQAGTILGALQ